MNHPVDNPGPHGRGLKAPRRLSKELVSARPEARRPTPPLMRLLPTKAARSVVRLSLDVLLFIPTGGAPLKPRL